MADEEVLVERVLTHILDMANARCTLSLEDISAEQDQSVQAILTGLYHLHEELEHREQRRLDAEREARERSTPVLELGPGILLIPLIGTLDAERAEQLSVRALDAVSRSGARVLIVDVTGLVDVDTFVAGRLRELFSALSLLGTKAILTGLGAKVARSLVSLGVELGELRTLATLSDGLRLGFRLAGEGR